MGDEVSSETRLGLAKLADDIEELVARLKRYTRADQFHRHKDIVAIAESIERAQSSLGLPAYIRLLQLDQPFFQGARSAFKVEIVDPKFPGEGAFIFTISVLPLPNKNLQAINDSNLAIVEELLNSNLRHIMRLIASVAGSDSKENESRKGEIDKIAKQLTGRRGPIFRFLSRHPHGVRFREYMDSEDDEGKRLTKSENHESIASMIRALSRELEDHNWSATASIEADLIKVEKLGEAKA